MLAAGVTVASLEVVTTVSFLKPPVAFGAASVVVVVSAAVVVSAGLVSPVVAVSVVAASVAVLAAAAAEELALALADGSASLIEVTM